MRTHRIPIVLNPVRARCPWASILRRFVWSFVVLFALTAAVRADEPSAPETPTKETPPVVKKPVDKLVFGVFPCGPDAVVDADTLRMPNGQPSVRVLGIDAEEVFRKEEDRKASAADFAQYARAKRGESLRPVKYATPAGEAAKRFVIALMKDVKQVRLERDHLAAPATGTYGRRLAHVFLLRPGGPVNLAEAVIRAGHSPYFVKYGRSVRFDDLYRHAEKEAQDAGRGIWGKTGPAHYPDYDERLAWWRQRADQVARWKAKCDQPDHVTLGEPAATAKMRARIGKEAVLFGLFTRELTPRAGDRWILLLGHEPRRGVPLVFFSKEVFDSLDRNAITSLYLTVRGTLTLHRGLPQVVIERADQISTR